MSSMEVETEETEHSEQDPKRGSVSPTSSDEISEEDEDREGFQNNVEFVLTCLGLAVGLGNIWRFPTRAYENGGSAFLIPYLTCAALFGFPSLYFEFLVGQFHRTSPPLIYRKVRRTLEGVGWMGVFVSAIVAIYYIVLVSWISIYLVNILRGHFATWTRCDNAWNDASTCIDMIRQKTECRHNDTFFVEGLCRNGSELENVTLVSATEQYFTSYIVDPSDGLLHFDSINWPFFLSMSVCWILTGLGIVKGNRIIGKIAYVSVLLPYVIVVVLFVRGITLEGASEGLYYYFGKPDYSKLLHFKTWTEALKQLCFSLALGHGGLMSLASYSKKRNNVFRDACIVIVGDTVMSLVGGAAVFSTLGFLATQRGVTVPEVVRSGTSLAFVVYPEAMTQMPLPWLWSFLFFLMLFLLGASSEIAMVEVFCSCLYDQIPGARRKKWLVVGIWCLVLSALGIVFSTRAGIYWFELFDEYAAGFSSVCTIFFELVVIMYLYGRHNFRADIVAVLGEPRSELTKWIGPHSPYFTINWMCISPLIAIVLVALSFIRDYPYMGKPDVYPPIFDILGWFIALIPVLLIPLFCCVNWLRFLNDSEDVESSRDVYE